MDKAQPNDLTTTLTTPLKNWLIKLKIFKNIFISHLRQLFSSIKFARITSRLIAAKSLVSKQYKFSCETFCECWKCFRRFFLLSFATFFEARWRREISVVPSGGVECYKWRRRWASQGTRWDYLVEVNLWLTFQDLQLSNKTPSRDSGSTSFMKLIFVYSTVKTSN